MKGHFSVSKYSDAIASVSKQDRQVKLVDNILASRKLSDLIKDKNRIANAIDLAINARYHLDPFFDPYEIISLDKQALIEEIFITLNTFSEHSISPLFRIEIPKDKISNRVIKYYSIKDYSIRYFLSMLLSEKITVKENVYGGRNEIFVINKGDKYEDERRRFQSIQNSMLLSRNYDWVVYVDIKSYYDNITKDILIAIIKKKLGLDESDIIIILANIYFENITIGCWCDNYLQNIYLNDLDAILSAHGWLFYRMTDDFRILCKSKEEAELAFQIIKTELQNLNLSINRDKHFVLKPMTTVDRFLVNEKDFEVAELSPIINLNKISQYSIENVFNLTRDSSGFEWVNYKYDIKFQRKFTYRDEILEKSGFQINGTDVKEIIDDLEQKKNLTTYDFDILFEIIFNTYSSSYQFTNRVINLFILHAFTNNEELENEDIITKVFKKLAFNCKSGSKSFISYIFLNKIFIQGYTFSNQIEKYSNWILEWMFEMIISNDYKYSYLLRVVRYIIEHNLFEIVDKTICNHFKKDKFWASLIDLEDDIKKKESKYGYDLNTIYFLEGLFTESNLLNLIRADYYFNRDNYNYGKALEYYKLILKTKNISSKYFEIAYCFYQEKSYKQALKYYTLYLKTHNSASAYNNRALIYIELKKHSEALIDFWKAIEIEEHIRYYDNRASLYMKINQFYQALFDLNRGIELREINQLEEYRFLYLKRASVKKELDDIESALEDIEFYYRHHGFFDYAEQIKLLFDGELLYEYNKRLTKYKVKPYSKNK